MYLKLYGVAGFYIRRQANSRADIIRSGCLPLHLFLSLWCLDAIVCALLRFLETAWRTLVPNGFNRHRLNIITVINGLSVFKYRLAFHRSISMDGDPLLPLDILIHLIVSTRCGKSGCVVEGCAGSIGVADLKVTILPVGAVNLRDLRLKTGHEVAEGRLIICVSCVALLEYRRFCMLLHSIPVHAVRRLHDGVRRIRFVVVSTAVPKAVSTLRTCLHDTVAHTAKNRIACGTWESSCNLFGLSGTMPTATSMAFGRRRSEISG